MSTDNLDRFNDGMGEWLEANGVVLLGTTWDRRIICTVDLNRLKGAIYRLITDAGGKPYDDSDGDGMDGTL